VGTEPDDRREELARAGARRENRDRDVGMVVIWEGVVIILVPCLIVFVVWRTGLVKSNSTGLLLGPVLFGGMWVIGRGRRMRAASGEAVLAEDERLPVVYLRPFDADNRKVYTAWGSRVRPSSREPYITHEERLARTLRKVGPFVAVGDPTEELPLLGAARVYASDGGWRATVDELSARAGVVLLQTGDSEGLAWEVHHVVELGAPERVILALPRADSRRKRRRLYDAFRQRFGDVFPRPLPESIGHSQFAYFDADWTPELIERGVPLPVDDAPRDVALRRLAREFKIMWGPRWLRWGAYITAFFLAVFAYQVASGSYA
jgi:hypothetical protein